MVLNSLKKILLFSCVGNIFEVTPSYNDLVD